MVILHSRWHRSFAFGILTNHRYLMLFQAQRTGSSFVYKQRYAAVFDERYIQWLLSASLTTLGMVCPQITIGPRTFTLDKYLGSGHYSHGYELKIDGTTIVVKQFSDMKHANHEREIYEALAGIAGVTQRCSLQPQEELFVAVHPKGEPFDLISHPINEAHVRGLRAALTAMHAKGLAHHDVGPCNMYYLDATHALLRRLNVVFVKGPLNLSFVPLSTALRR